MRVITAAELLLPHNCASCGSCDPGRKYIDFGITEEFVGTPYVCSECFRSLAPMMGYASDEVIENLHKGLRTKSYKIEDLQFRIEALKNVVAVLCTDSRIVLESIDDSIAAAISRMEAANRVQESDFPSDESGAEFDEFAGVEGIDDLLSAGNDLLAEDSEPAK